jgi:uncharacterized membrane protein YeaQ/YmgE (transglycosylase-associated protein family)
MRQIAESAIVYLRSNLLSNFAIALIAGGVACRSLGADRLSGPVVYCLIGMTGLFVSQFLIINFGLVEYLEQVGGFRMLIDFFAAYAACVFITAMISAINPN